MTPFGLMQLHVPHLHRVLLATSCVEGVGVWAGEAEHGEETETCAAGQLFELP